MRIILTLLFILSAIPAFTQVAVNSNGANPDGSAMLDINANDKGLLIPRLTSGERLLIKNPAAGLLVYDKDRLSIYMYDGDSWRPFAFASQNNLQPVMRKPVGAHPNGNFGYCASLYGDYAIVGAPSDTVKGVNTGAAYVFHREEGNWKQMVKISASNGVAGDQFGYSVDIYKDIIVVGAPNKAISNELGRGRVYVFRLIQGVWTAMAGLQAPDGKLNDHFGSAVAIYENILVAGASGRDHSNLENPGSVYPFALNNNVWESRGIINAWQNSANNYFGDHLDFWNYELAVSATNLIIDGVTCGGVFMYSTNLTGTMWVNGDLMEPTIKQPNMHFGSTVSLGNSHMVITATGFDGSEGSNTGGWFAYNKPNGAWQYFTGVGHAAAPAEQMGQSSAVDGALSTIYVGSPNWEVMKGKVIVLDGYVKEIHHPDPYAPGVFGKAVAAHFGHYIITCYNNDAVFFGKIF
jgi:hypothetical protein